MSFAPRHLRYRAVWITVGWFLVATVVWASLTPSPPDFGLAGEDKLEHFTAYLALALWFGALYNGWPRAIHALGLVLMGVGLEILQEAGGVRRLEAWDMLANGFGVLAGWLVSHSSAGLFLCHLERAIARPPRGP